MVVLRERITEDEMIAVFLRGEIHGRHRDELLAICVDIRLSEEALRSPNTRDEQENCRRRLALTRHRGWDTREGLCNGLPLDINWHRATIGLEDLRERVFYISYFWEQFSDGTRSPATIAARLAAGPNEHLRAYGVGVYGEILRGIRLGHLPAEPIFVAEPSLERLVILEGHVRLTSYLVDPTCVPFPLNVIVGISTDIADWSEW